jgi:hypothetical protein
MNIRSTRSALCFAIAMTTTPVLAQSPDPMNGTWTGKVAQNSGASNYTVVMTIGASTVETDYPELKCGGKLTRVGAANGYVFYTEKITRGGQGTGGSCIDGAITITPSGNALAWGWSAPIRARSTSPGAR